MIAIVDYGMGNLRNVRRAFSELGYDCVVTEDPEVIRSAGKVVLPGVGAFGEAMRRIEALGVRSPIEDVISRGVPLLGICLGMQLLFEQSEESPGARGFGFFPGSVLRFGNDVKVPHIGWNDVSPLSSDGCAGVPTVPGCFYFVHSYYVPILKYTAGTTEYGRQFSSSVRKGSVIGVQFHPEKSQDGGMALLDEFASL